VVFNPNFTHIFYRETKLFSDLLIPNAKMAKIMEECRQDCFWFCSWRENFTMLQEEEQGVPASEANLAHCNACSSCEIGSPM